MRSRSKQTGVSMIAILGVMSALMVLTAIYNKVISGKATMQTQYEAQANAIDLQKSAEALRIKIASLRITYGAIDPQIFSNQITSVSSLWSAMPMPANAASVAQTAWVMAANDRITIPVSGETMRVATIDVTARVCTALNALQIKSEDPTMTTAVNGFGGTTFSISNTGFNAGMPADLFCVQGGGTSGGRIYLGLSSS